MTNPTDKNQLSPQALAGIVAFLLGLNLAAIYGQAAYFRPELTNNNGFEDWFVPIGVSMAIEGIGVFLAFMAMKNLLADQSAGMLRLGSYAIGLLIGFINYWHYAGEQLTPTVEAVVFGLLSSASPWLWAILSRHLNQARLAELGMTDARLVKLSTARKVLHPTKSFRVIRFAAWHGIKQPERAVGEWERWRSERRPGRVRFRRRPTMVAQATTWSDDQVDPVEQLPIPTSPMVGQIPDPDELWERYGQPAVHDRPYTPDPVVEVGDQTDQVDRRPIPDDVLIDQFGDQLRALRDEGRLSRYRVETLCNVHKAQALRLIDDITKETDQVATGKEAA